MEKLADELRAVDIEPWLCEMDVLYGDDFVAEIEKGLKEADLTVLVWSPDAAPRHGQVKNGDQCLPVRSKSPERAWASFLLRDAELPELLTYKTSY